MVKNIKWHKAKAALVFLLVLLLVLIVPLSTFAASKNDVVSAASALAARGECVYYQKTLQVIYSHYWNLTVVKVVGEIWTDSGFYYYTYRFCENNSKILYTELERW